MKRSEAELKLLQISGISSGLKLFLDKRELAEEFIKKHPLYYDKSKLWWIWNPYEFRWELTDETEILNFIPNFAQNNIIRSHEKNEILEALRQVARKNKPRDIKKSWIQFKDIIWDFNTGDKFKATPEYFVVNPIPYKISGDPRTPTIDKIFEQWVGKKYVKLLHQIIAYCLFPSYPLHRLFCLIGEGLNGKSCFLKILKKFLGENNVSSTELDTLLNSRFEMVKLHKKLSCVMGETNFSEISKTSILKRLTGGDMIGFEYKNKNPFDEVNYAKIIIATNNLPATTDKTLGFYRRWIIIDFPNKFSEKKDIVETIPEGEFENLATNSLIYLKELMDLREFHNEGTIEERIEKYESHSNFLEKFIELFIGRDDPDSFITKASFYRKFIAWSKENKYRTLSDKSIGKKMRELGVESGRKTMEIDGKSIQAGVWFGIKWKDS